MRYAFRAAGWAAMGLLMIGIVPCAAPAEVQKTGKASYQLAMHFENVSQKYLANAISTAGSGSGVLYHSQGQGFAHGLAAECIGIAEVTDLAKGVWPNLITRCVLRDRDGDVLFLAFRCSLESYAGRCGGKIEGGTGKYEAITGTASIAVAVPGNVRRTCVAAAKDEDCRVSYPSFAAVPVGTTYLVKQEMAWPLELEWRIP